MSNEEIWWPYEFDFGEEYKDIVKQIRRLNDEHMFKVAKLLENALETFADNAERGGIVAQRIRELHKPVYKDSWMEAEAGGEYCSTCKGQMYPCETIKALGGEQE
jgi:hypothetical protein